MKIEKNKIVFGSVLVVVVIFIVAYTMYIFGGSEDDSLPIKQTLVPELEQEQEDYKSKLDAVNALKEVRETNAPSIYDERLIDSLGYYDPDLKNKQKEKIVDSIYRMGRINYTEESYRKPKTEGEEVVIKTPVVETIPFPEDVQPKELALEHQLFYSSSPMSKESIISGSDSTEKEILVEVDGQQIIKAGYRLRMLLMEDAILNSKLILKNTPVFGFVSFQPNRVLIEIQNINHHPVRLKAYDLQDGSEGIYVENSIRADASREVIDDIIQDIDIPGVPQVGGIKKVFQRNNRNIKVTVTNNYKLILKPIR